MEPIKLHYVYDTTNTLIKVCASFKEAHSFCVSRNRLDWRIE